MRLRTSLSYLCTIIGLYCPIIAYAQEIDAAQSSTTFVMTEAQTHQLHVRTLAASCAACHGTLGNNAQLHAPDASKLVQLAAIKPTEFINAMQAFKSGSRVATVMHRHARGLTMQEISDLAEFFSEQPLRQPAKLPSQRLSRDHEN
jgi:cytochrome c553